MVVTLNPRLSSHEMTAMTRIMTLSRVEAGLSRTVACSFPLARMLASRKWSYRPIGNWPIGGRLFRSAVFLLLVIPADIHRFGLLEAGSRGFREKSESLWLAVWRHDREWTGTDGETIVRDSIRFEARLRLAEPLLAPLYQAVFRNRHRRLRKLFGGLPPVQ